MPLSWRPGGLEDSSFCFLGFTLDISMLLDQGGRVVPGGAARNQKVIQLQTAPSP